MKLVHQLLLEFENGSDTHTLGELVAKFGRQIPPERAVRIYKEDSKGGISRNWTTEQKIFRGRRYIISYMMSDLMHDELVEKLPGTKRNSDNHVYRMTDKGRASLARRKTMHWSSASLLEAKKCLRNQLKEFLETFGWIPVHELVELAKENVTDADAMEYRQHNNRLKAGTKEPMTPEVGRRILVGWALQQFKRRVEYKTDEKGVKHVRFKPQQPEGGKP